jgi:hypothetical protein
MSFQVWKGAHNTCILNNATSRALKIPGYGLRKGLMLPYQAFQYHIKEQATAGLRPESKKELYNLQNATLWKIVERIFGYIKKKFQILQVAPKIKLRKQVRLIYSLVMLWNFMWKHETVEKIFDKYSNKDTTIYWGAAALIFVSTQLKYICLIFCFNSHTSAAFSTLGSSCLKIISNYFINQFELLNQFKILLWSDPFKENRQQRLTENKNLINCEAWGSIT